MRLMHIYFLILICFIVAVGCKGEKNQALANGDTVVHLDNVESHLEAVDVISVDGWTELNNDNQALISNTCKLLVGNGRYYILDRNRACVLVFGSDGEFIGSIGSKGDGMAEYPAVYDFAIDTDRERIIMLSSRSEVYIYDFNGKFIRHTRLSDEDFSNIAYHNGRYVATTAYSSYQRHDNEDCFLLYEFTADLECSAKWLAYSTPLQPLHSFFTDRLQGCESEMYYVDNINMCIYKLPQDKAGIPMEVLRFHCSNPMPIDAYSDIMTFMSRQHDYDWLHDVMLCKDAILTTYVSGGAYRVSINRWNGDLVKAGLYHGTVPMASYGPDGYMYSVIMPDEYMNVWQSMSISQPDVKPTYDSNAMILKWHLTL